MLTAKESGSHTARRRSAAEIAAWTLLVLLLLADLALIFCHAWFVGEHEVIDNVWSVEADGGYAEKLQYVKWSAAALLLLALTLTRRRLIYIAWSVVFLYFVADDATSLHEQVGHWLAEELQLESIQQAYLAWFPGLYLRPRDFGELAVVLAVATTIAAMLLFSWPPRMAKRDRLVAVYLLLWLALFAFFSVGIDMVHIMALDPITGFTPTTYLLGIVEDGGEMICASLLVGGLAQELARP